MHFGRKTGTLFVQCRVMDSEGWRKYLLMDSEGWSKYLLRGLSRVRFREFDCEKLKPLWEPDQAQRAKPALEAS